MLLEYSQYPPKIRIYKNFYRHRHQYPKTSPYGQISSHVCQRAHHRTTMAELTFPNFVHHLLFYKSTAKARKHHWDLSIHPYLLKNTGNHHTILDQIHYLSMKYLAKESHPSSVFINSFDVVVPCICDTCIQDIWIRNRNIYADTTIL